MTTVHATAPPITLVVESGPALANVGPLPHGDWHLGRAPENDVALINAAVSRQHALLAVVNGRWTLRDLDSTQGSFVNGHRLVANSDTHLIAGDHVRIGPWTLRVRFDSATDAVPASVRRPTIIGSVPQQRLRALFALAHTAQNADDENELLGALCRDLGDSLAYDRVALLRLNDTRVQVCAVHARDTQAEQRPYSTTLMRAAEPEQPALLESIAAGDLGASLIANPVAHALCIQLTGVVEPTWLYLDRAEPFADSDGSVFAYVEAAARIAALAISHRDGVRAAAAHERLAAELSQARVLQTQLCASRAGRLGELDYAFSTEPGAGMCGDFVDVLRANDGAVWCMVGDVVGHGTAAAMLMATALAILRSECRRSDSAAAVADHLSAELARVLAQGQFITLWLARIDHDGRVAIVDAGHGQCWHRDATRQVTLLTLRGHPPIGVLTDTRHQAEHLMLEAGDGLVVATDGFTDAMVGANAGAAFADAINATASANEVVVHLGTMLHVDNRRDDASVLVLFRDVAPR